MGFCDTGFDNRRFGPLVREYVLRRSAGHHFQVSVHGKRLSYCMIRKNACSVFKAFLLSKCPDDIRQNGSQDSLSALLEHQRRSCSWHPNKSDISIFIYRDPFERIVSLFENKFVEARGEEAIRANFTKITGETVDSTSFAHFVTRYLTQYRRGIDAHFRLQRGHLLPMLYTHAIAIERLYPTMSEIIGQAEAEIFFARPKNAASCPRAAVSGASKMSVAELRRIQSNYGVLPDAASLLTDELMLVIKRIYHLDMVFAKGVTRR